LIGLAMGCARQRLTPVGQVAHPFNSSKTIFYYSQSVPTTIQHMAFAIGPFEMHDMLAASDSRGSGVAGLGAKTSATAAHAAQDGDAGQLQLLAFCLPGRMDELRASVATVRLAVDYYSRDFGSYPFSSLKLVFVDEPPADCHAASTLSLLSSDLLHAANVIEQALETRLVLHQTVAFQWFGINIIQRAWSDTWLVNGLSQHMAALFLRKLMGQNEYRFRLKKDVDRLCAWDVGMPPMYQHGVGEPPDEALLPFINLKAPLVLYILDRRLCKAGASLGLGRVVPRVLLQALTGEMANNALSTHNFLRTCRKVSNVDLRTFTEQWIYGSGCPRFFVDAEFNRKKLIIEFHIRQESPAAIFAANHPEEAAHSNPVAVFEGQMTARIHEADGTPYEHVFDINSVSKKIEVPFNTKYKRVRRNTKRFQARQAAAAAAAEGDQDAAEAMTMLDLGFCECCDDRPANRY
jgi:transcription initiation factor TFIID subunit 2